MTSPAMLARLGASAEMAEGAEAIEGRISVPLRSSAIASADYEIATQTLTINFINSGSYDYPNTPITTFYELCNAPSAGQYYCTNIKIG